MSDKDDYGDCPMCGSHSLEFDEKPSFGRHSCFVKCKECGFESRAEPPPHHLRNYLKTIRDVRHATNARNLLDKIMRLGFMRQVFLDLKGGHGVNHPDAEVLIPAFIAAGVAKKEDFEGSKNDKATN